ncbi:helix-turn-helix domain-containing protein [Streptomyces scabiei]|uniref:AlbA family DNA-binding domain-containing protein n=1 Tax=Streptomyces scabiei TaxID=1930 RepID=UPI0036EB66F6
MALNVSTDRPLRSPRQLLELVTAIRDAGEHDENDWIEWKSSYDLTKKEIRATLARHIIGMANRMPEKSAAICQGYGYIVIGVEPGNVEGVASIDLADLDSGLQPYLGHLGPEWSANYVPLDGCTILVLTVEPPQMGDPIHTLNKEFANYAAGMIFVRRSGRTVQANPGEVISLTRRATQSTSTSQSMTLTPDSDPVEIPLWKFNEYIDQQCKRREELLIHPKNSTRRPNSLGMASLDSRDENDYRKEVTEHLEDYREFLLNLARQSYVRGGAGKLQLTISNPDQTSHQGVRVELTFSTRLSAILADDYADEEFTQPRPPEPLGTRVSALFNSRIINSIIPPYHGPNETEISIEPGTVVFNVSSVRAEGHVKLPKIHFIADSWSDDEGVITWAITALNSGGRVRGSIHLNQVGVATVASNEVDSQRSD